MTITRTNTQSTGTQKLVYLVTKFPLLSETFIYEELLALYDLGYSPRFFAFYNTGQNAHQYAQSLGDSITYLPPIASKAHLTAHWYFIKTRFRAYISSLAKIISDTWQSPVIAAKSLYAFAKGVTLAHLLSNDRPDHLHAHWATMPTTAVMVASQLLDISFSFTSHAWDIFKQPAMLKTKLRTADFNVTISKYNRRYLQKLCPDSAERIRVIRCGINLERFNYRQKYPENTIPHILTVGRLVEKKGMTYLVKACAELRDNGTKFICTIVGDGPQREKLKRLILDHNLQECVKLAGSMPQEQLQGLWQQAGIFVLPCTITKNGNRDGIPVVLMEAMAAGIPVISTNISGIPELVEENVTGLLVPPNDATQLSKAIIKLLNDHQLAMRIIEPGRKRIESEYDISNNAKQKAHLFAAILSEKA